MKPGERRAIEAALAEVRAYFKPIDGEVWAPVPGAPRKAISTHHRVLSLAGPDGRGRHHGATILAQVGRLPRLPGPSALGEDPTIQRAVLAAFDRLPESGDRALAVHGSRALSSDCAGRRTTRRRWPSGASRRRRGSLRG